MLITKHIFCRYGGLITNLLQNNNPLPGKQADSTPVHPGVGIILLKKKDCFLATQKIISFAGCFCLCLKNIKASSKSEVMA